MTARAALRGIIRLKLEARLLPTSTARRVWAGPGANEVCSVCDEAITKSENLYEWEDEDRKMCMHIVCYEVWNEERILGDGGSK